MTQVELTPTTNRESQLVRALGNVWNVTGDAWLMPCFKGTLGLNITSLDGSHTRNVKFDGNVKVLHGF